VLDYFMDQQQPNRVRRMMPLKEPGVVWLFGLLSTRDDHGNEALLTHFTRRKDLATQVEQGLARFDDEAGIFKKIANLELTNVWRFPRGNAVKHGDYYYFASPFCHTRVKAQWSDLIDPDKYEALAFDPATKSYAWRRDRDPTTQKEERELLRDGKLAADAARYRLLDAAGEEVTIHGASVSWNEYRKRWVLV